MTLEIDAGQVKQYESDLKHFARKAYPFATRQTVNKAAFETRRGYQARIREDLTLRNRWTEQSVRVEQARTLTVSRQAAIVGSVADYMATQEFGGVEKGGGKYKPIATSYSAGLPEDAKPRTRLPRKPNKLSNIQLKSRGRKLSRRARNKVAVLMAAKSGDKYVWLDLGKRQGLFRVLGGKRNPRVRMVWDMSRRSVRVPKKPLLLPATRAVQAQLPQYYAEALVFQLKRAKVFGYR